MWMHSWSKRDLMKRRLLAQLGGILGKPMACLNSDSESMLHIHLVQHSCSEMLKRSNFPILFLFSVHVRLMNGLEVKSTNLWLSA